MVAISNTGPPVPAGDVSDLPAGPADPAHGEGPSVARERPAAAATTGAPAAAGRYRPGYETVAELVLAKIAEEGLQVGDRLPTEREMAADFGVGRAVIREAVKMLTAMGRITVRKGAGISVAAPQASGLAVLTGFQPTSGDQVRMLFDYRRLIEGEAARCAALNAKPQEVRELAEHAEASLVAADQDDTRAFEDADARFHRMLTRAAHNDFLEASGEIVQTHKAMVNQLLFLGQQPGSLVVAARQHVQIAEHVHDGDADAAAATAVAHTDTTAAQFERRIRERLLGTVQQGEDGR